MTAAEAEATTVESNGNGQVTTEVALARLRLFLSPHARTETGETSDDSISGTTRDDDSVRGAVSDSALVPKTGEGMLCKTIA